MGTIEGNGESRTATSLLPEEEYRYAMRVRRRMNASSRLLVSGVRCRSLTILLGVWVGVLTLGCPGPTPMLDAAIADTRTDTASDAQAGDPCAVTDWGRCPTLDEVLAWGRAVSPTEELRIGPGCGPYESPMGLNLASRLVVGAGVRLQFAELNARSGLALCGTAEAPVRLGADGAAWLGVSASGEVTIRHAEFRGNVETALDTSATTLSVESAAVLTVGRVAIVASTETMAGVGEGNRYTSGLVNEARGTTLRAGAVLHGQSAAWSVQTRGTLNAADLTLRPGVRMIFDDSASLRVSGSFTVELGSEPTVLTAAEGERWSGLSLVDAAAHSIRGARIERAQTAIVLEEGDLTLGASTIRACEQGIVLRLDSSRLAMEGGVAFEQTTIPVDVPVMTAASLAVCTFDEAATEFRARLTRFEGTATLPRVSAPWRLTGEWVDVGASLHIESDTRLVSGHLGVAGELTVVDAELSVPGGGPGRGITVPDGGTLHLDRATLRGMEGSYFVFEERGPRACIVIKDGASAELRDVALPGATCDVAVFISSDVRSVRGSGAFTSDAPAQVQIQANGIPAASGFLRGVSWPTDRESIHIRGDEIDRTVLVPNVPGGYVYGGAEVIATGILEFEEGVHLASGSSPTHVRGGVLRGHGTTETPLRLGRVAATGEGTVELTHVVFRGDSADSDYWACFEASDAAAVVLRDAHFENCEVAFRAGGGPSLDLARLDTSDATTGYEIQAELLGAITEPILGVSRHLLLTGGTVPGGTVWRSLGVPWLVTCNGGCTTSGVVISGSVRIAAPIEILFDSTRPPERVGLVVVEGGSLRAEGSGRNIVFGSDRSDAPPGAWGFLNFERGSFGVLRDVLLRDGGGWVGSPIWLTPGATLSVTDTEFRNSLEHDIRVDCGATLTESGNVYTTGIQRTPCP